jgi:hypothetical protein
MLLHSAISLNKGLSSSKNNSVNILHSSSLAKKWPLSSYKNQLNYDCQFSFLFDITLLYCPRHYSSLRLELTLGYTL